MKALTVASSIKEEGKYLGVYHKVAGKWKGAAFYITAND
jgi:hypothetical protein